jgi:diguanylate cyclase (GGDEF)-like protein
MKDMMITASNEHFIILHQLGGLSMHSFLLLLQLLPLLFLSYSAIEIIRRGPRHTENRLAAITMLGLFLMFLSELFQAILPLEYTIGIAVYLKYPASFLAGGLSMMLHYLLAKRVLPFSWLYSSIIPLTITSSYFYILFMHGPSALIDGIQTFVWWKTEQVSPLMELLLSGLGVFALCNTSLCIWVLRSKAPKEKKKQFSLLFWTGLTYYGATILLTIIVEMLKPEILLPSSVVAVPTLVWGVTILMLIEQKNLLPSASRKFEILYKLSPAAILLLDKDMIVKEYNPSAVRIFGKALEKGPVAFHEFINENERIAFLNQYRGSFPHMPWTNRELVVHSYEGETKTLLMDGDMMNSNDEWFMLAVIHDISLRKEEEDRANYLALHDTLTKLPNRLYFHRKLEEQLIAVQNNPRRLAVLLIDMDRFKLINDTLGHQYGDQALIEIASRLTLCLGKVDLLARLGGDEFVVLMSDIAEYDDVICTAEKMVAQFSEPVTLQNRDFHLATSIGVSFYPEDGVSADHLVKNADIAMYHAKNNGGSQFRCYTREVNAEFQQEVEMEARLRKALDNEEFRLVYQPQLELEHGRLIGTEALIRWNTKEWGDVPPSDFIPLAENTGLILSIGRWVLEEACRQTKEWEDRGLIDLTITVNVSAVQLIQPDFVDIVVRTLKSTGLHPSKLCLEITESVLVSKLQVALKMINELVEIGVFISMDDFGTGYSSLSIIQQLPIHIIKIDRSFIQNLSQAQPERSVIPSIVTMSHSLGKKVIAEGIEEEWQFDMLKSIGGDAAQGYFFSKPLPPDQVLKFYMHWKNTPQNAKIRP